MNGVLLPYQNKWIDEKNPVKVCEKSRRVGISWATAAEAALISGATKGMDTWYIGYNKDMAEEFIRDSANWLKNYNLVAREMQQEIIKDDGKDILTYIIRCSSGYRITALSSRPSNLRGKQGFIIIDEAAFHDQLNELIKAAMAMLIWGGRVAIISTHNGVDNPFNQLCEDIRSHRIDYALHKITLDNALSQGLYRRICEVIGKKYSRDIETIWRKKLYDFYGDGAAEELDVIPSNSGGAALSRTLLESRAIACPVLCLHKKTSFSEYPEHLRAAEINDWCANNLLTALEALDSNNAYVVGEDFARSGDLTVIAVLMLAKNLQRIPVMQVELHNMPYKQQEQILFFLCDRLPYLQKLAMDATGNGEYLAESARDRYGSKVDAIKLSNKFYAENMPKFKADIEDQTMLVPKDANTIDDLRALTNIDGVIKLSAKKTSSDKKRHGDAAIALALAHFASFQDAKEYGYDTPDNAAGASLFKRGYL